MPSTQSPNAEARLEDLDVREVSVVDRPANKKKFLIVKSADGLEVIRMEEGMPRTAIVASQAEELGYIPDPDPVEPAEAVTKEDADDSLLDLLGLGDDAAPETTDEPAASEDEPVTIEKGVKDAAIKASSAALQKLMALANILKDGAEKGSDVPKDLSNQLNQIASAIVALLDKLGGKADEAADDGDAEKTQKADTKAAFAAVKAAVAKMMAAVNKIKAMDDAAKEVPADALKDMANVAKALELLAKKFGGDDKPEDDAADADKKKDKEPTKKALEVFLKREDDSEDPEVIIKAGAKMRRARLSKLRIAIKALNEVLAELDPNGAEADAKDKGKKPTKKAEDAQEEAPEMKEDIQKILTMVTALNEKVEGMEGQIEDITKRVGDMEGTPPASASGDDPPADPVEKKKGSLWSNIIR